jgi:hypothetical protein
MTREACNGCKTKKRKEKKKRVLKKNKSAGNPRKKSRKPNCSRRLSSLATKEEYSPFSLSRLFPPRGSKARFRSFGKKLTNWFFLTS